MGRDKVQREELGFGWLQTFRATKYDVLSRTFDQFRSRGKRLFELVPMKQVADRARNSSQDAVRTTTDLIDNDISFVIEAKAGWESKGGRFDDIEGKPFIRRPIDWSNNALEL